MTEEIKNKNKLVSFAEAVEALQRGDSIFRFGNAYPSYSIGSLGILERIYNGGSGGDMVEGSFRNPYHFSVEEQNSNDWIIWPKVEVDKIKEENRKWYQEKYTVSASPDITVSNTDPREITYPVVLPPSSNAGTGPSWKQLGIFKFWGLK